MVRVANEGCRNLNFAQVTHPGIIPSDIYIGRLTNNGGKREKKLRKKNYKFESGTVACPELPKGESQCPLMIRGPQSPLSKPSTLQKSRPNSVFGSLGRKSANLLQEKPSEIVDAIPIDGDQAVEAGRNSGSKTVLHHGEVQTTSGLFRKKKEYLVLTDTHLIRYKNQSKASDSFPSIPPLLRRSNAIRHASTASIGSLQDLQSLNSHGSLESEYAICLRQVVAAYKVEDGRPFFIIEVVYMDEEINSVGSIQLMLPDLVEADFWRISIREASQKARLIASQPFPDRLVRYMVYVLESSQDYDARHFQFFKVVRKISSKFNGKSSPEDLAKLGTSVFYMVVGINQIHFMSLPEFGEPSLCLENIKSNKSSYGLVTLVAMEVNNADDAFQLGFR
jgi:hypothetical protein